MVDGAIINTNTTTISATFSDARTSVDENNIVLKINGNDVTASATINSTSIVYPASGWSNGDIAVDLSVSDAAAESWVFNVNVTSQPYFACAVTVAEHVYFKIHIIIIMSITL